MIVILALPIWNVTDVEVRDNDWYSDEEIVQVSMIKNNNILSLSLKEAKSNLLKLPYIKNAVIKYYFPGKVIIKLSERKPLGYVPFMGTYLCIDDEGRVIEQTTDMHTRLPVIQGLDFDEFKVQETLPVENEDNLLCSIELIEALRKHKYHEKVKGLDVYDLEQIHLYVDNLDVIIGNIGDFDKKLQWLIETHEAYDMGVLDLSNIKNGQATLSPIT
ncbi:MAG: FtsQ-type protein [Clostridia bacterium]|jgi:cell division protein FtsQ|nr:FtsQ-type protein [Clostridia bacterium]